MRGVAKPMRVNTGYSRFLQVSHSRRNTQTRLCVDTGTPRSEVQGKDDEGFEDKMRRMTTLLFEQTERGVELDTVIRERLEALGLAKLSGLSHRQPDPKG